MNVVVTEIDGNGRITRGILDTAGDGDARCDAELVERAAMDVPPPYRAVKGSPVYHVRAGDKTVLIGEAELVGPLRELVRTALANKQRDAAPRPRAEPSAAAVPRPRTPGPSVPAQPR